jgi:hypothetical protein
MSATNLDAAVLDAWEHAYGLHPIARGLSLLRIEDPSASFETMAVRSVGQRDAALLALRDRLFGPRLNCLVACPACGCQAELDFTVGEVMAKDNAGQECSMEFRERTWTVRRLTSADLVAVLRRASGDEQHAELLRRCLVAPEGQCGNDIDPELAERLTAALAELDPQADVRIAVSCPECGHGWSARFDILGHLWREVDVWARRILSEIHSLASTYGWSERAILEMSHWRRQIYLEQLRQ